MKLSTRAVYGLRALIDLGMNSETDAVSLQTIALRQNLSVSYLEQLIAKLRKAGLVTSSRGVTGGYRLARDPKEISVGDVLRVLEGDLNAVKCPGTAGETTCTGKEPEGGCQGADLCVAKFVWQRINDSINNAVDTMMLIDLIDESRKVHGTETANEILEGGHIE